MWGERTVLSASGHGVPTLSEPFVLRLCPGRTESKGRDEPALKAERSRPRWGRQACPRIPAPELDSGRFPQLPDGVLG